MNETAFETIASAASVLKLDFTSAEFAKLAVDHGLSEDATDGNLRRYQKTIWNVTANSGQTA